MTPKEARRAWIDFCTGRPGATQLLTLKQFKSNLTIDADTTLAALAAAECDYQGYAAITDLDFPDATINGNDQGEVTSRLVTHTKTTGGTGNTVYGWWIERTDAGSNVRLVQVKKFTTPLDFTVDVAEAVKKYILRDNDLV